MNILTLNYSFSSLLIFIRTITDLNIINSEILDLSLYLSKLALFLITAIYNIDFSRNFITDTTSNDEISNVLIYNNYDYLINAILFLYQNDIEFVYHHLLSIICITICQYYNYHQIALFTLLLFNLSSPYLSIAKIFRINRNKVLANLNFILFAIIFFICRISTFSYILYIGLYDFNNSYDIKDSYYFIVIINSCALLILQLQIAWMYKIIMIIKNEFKILK